MWQEGNTRGRPRQENWINWIAEVAAYIRWEGIEHDTKAIDFYDEIKDRLKARKITDIPKYKAVESAISAVKSRIVEEEVTRAWAAEASKASRDPG